MRLPKIFSLLTFPVFWVSRSFDVQKYFENFFSFRMSETYQKSYQKCLPKIRFEKKTAIFGMFLKVSKITKNIKNRWYLSKLNPKNTKNFEKQMVYVKNKSKKYSKILKIDGNFGLFFGLFPKLVNFRFWFRLSKETGNFGFFFAKGGV